MTQGREALIRCRLLPDGTLEYEGWATGVQRCRPEELGERVRRVLADPRLPPLNTTGAGPTQLVDLYAAVMLPPHLRPLVRPSFDALRDLFGQARRAASEGSWARDQDTYAQPSPDPPSEAPRSPPHRRGRRLG